MVVRVRKEQAVRIAKNLRRKVAKVKKRKSKFRFGTFIGFG